MAVGSCCARAFAIARKANAATQASVTVRYTDSGQAGFALRAVGRTHGSAPTNRESLIRRLLLPRLHALLVVGLVDVEQADPCKAHLVDRPLAVADPVPRIRVVLVRRRVVVPRGDVNDRSRRQDRLHLVGIRIGDMPAELVVADAAQGFGSGVTGA